VVRAGLGREKKPAGARWVGPKRSIISSRRAALGPPLVTTRTPKLGFRSLEGVRQRFEQGKGRWVLEGREALSLVLAGLYVSRQAASPSAQGGEHEKLRARRAHEVPGTLPERDGHTES